MNAGNMGKGLLKKSENKTVRYGLMHSKSICEKKLFREIITKNEDSNESVE